MSTESTNCTQAAPLQPHEPPHRPAWCMRRTRLWCKRVRLWPAGGINAVTEDASGPSQPGPDWRGILGALQLGNSPDGAASLDSGERRASCPASPGWPQACRCRPEQAATPRSQARGVQYHRCPRAGRQLRWSGMPRLRWTSAHSQHL